MQSNESKHMKKISKITTAFNKMHKLPKALIKYGTYIFLGVYIVGTVLVILNNTVLPDNRYFDMVSKEIVKASFVLAAEAVIGSLVMDFMFKK